MLCFLAGTARYGAQRPQARSCLSSPAVPSPTESVLVSVYVQLYFSSERQPAALSGPMTLPTASASSAPVTLTGLSLTAGGVAGILLTPAPQWLLAACMGRGFRVQGAQPSRSPLV